MNTTIAQQIANEGGVEAYTRNSTRACCVFDLRQRR